MKKIVSYRMSSVGFESRIILFICFLLLSGSSLLAQNDQTVVKFNGSTDNSVNPRKEEKSINFFINGMTSVQDEVTIEKLLTNNAGIARARVSFISKECGIVTLQNSNINKAFLMDLLGKSNFTIHSYIERLISVPENKQANKTGSSEIQSQDSVGSYSKISASSNISPQEWLRQLQEMKKTAIERGSSTEKYDKAIKEVEKQLGNKSK